MKIIRRSSMSPAKDTLHVEFSVLWSPTYHVPVLWFTLNHVLPGVPPGVEAVYQYLVPETTRSGLRQIGVIGGISIAVRENCF